MLYLSRAVVSSAGGSFAPSDVSGLVLWYDGSDISTLWQDAAKTTPVTSDNDPVGAWLDKSAGAKLVTQSIAGERPIYKTAVQNGLSVLSYVSGTLKRIFAVGSVIDSGTTPSSANWTMFGVANTDSTSHRGGIFTSAETAYAGTLFADSTASKYIGKVQTNLDVVKNIVGASDLGSEFMQVTLQRNNTAVNGWQNGVAATPKAITAGSTIDNSYTRLFSDEEGFSSLQGSIAEVIVYDGAVSTSDREAVESYLVSKWGL